MPLLDVTMCVLVLEKPVLHSAAFGYCLLSLLPYVTILCRLQADLVRMNLHMPLFSLAGRAHRPLCMLAMGRHYVF